MEIGMDPRTSYPSPFMTRPDNVVKSDPVMHEQLWRVSLVLGDIRKLLSPATITFSLPWRYTMGVIPFTSGALALLSSVYVYKIKGLNELASTY